MAKFIYNGPSWAATSYPDDPLNFTNLSIEWSIPCISTAHRAQTNLDGIDKVKNQPKDLPIVWLYSEPISDLTRITGMTFKDVVTRNDWWEIREECNQHCLEEINNLGVPVLLIGAQSDIVNCNLTNIRVAHPSWQRWSAVAAGMTVGEKILVEPTDGGSFEFTNCWGAEILHRFIFENPNIMPDSSLVDAIWDVYYFQEELQRRGWFFEVHPNKHSNIEFAKFLRPILLDFLETTKDENYIVNR